MQSFLENIKFGTDGWRGILGVDFTMERLISVSIASAQELAYRYPIGLKSRKVVIGYDCRFMAKEMAIAVAAAVRGCELTPCLSDAPLPTPACSFAVVNTGAIGALVITASHNPPEWLGLKIKSHLGGSVDGDFTKAVEQRLEVGGVTAPKNLVNKLFNFRGDHLNHLKTKFDIPHISARLKSIGLELIIDSMHGSAANCITELFNEYSNDIIKEIRNNRDPLFDGNSPEPVEKNVNKLKKIIIDKNINKKSVMGIVFDGDGDRIAVIDEYGRYLSTQYLMPILIEYLSAKKRSTGCIVKTVSGCDLMRTVAEAHSRKVIEMPVGFKHIANQMKTEDVLIGGEESGGIGFGNHLPERDALYTVLVLLEGIAESGELLGQQFNNLKKKYGESYFDRLDLKFKNFEERESFERKLNQNPPSSIAGYKINEIKKIDGIKFCFKRGHWLMLRFSGTEPLLRIYCEAPDRKILEKTFDWARNYVKLF